MSRVPQESSCTSSSSAHGNTLSSGERLVASISTFLLLLILQRCPIEIHLQRYLSRPSIGLVKGMLYGERVNINTDGALLEAIQRLSRSLIGSPEVATFLTGIGIKLCLQRVTQSREASDTQQGQVYTEEQVLHAIIRGPGDGLPTGRTITVVKALAAHIRAFLPTSSTWTGLACEPSTSLRQAYGFLCICITASDIHSHSGSPVIQRYGELRCSGIAHEAALEYVGSLWSSTVLHLRDVVTLLARVHRVCLHSPCNPAAFPLLLSLVSNSCVVWLYLSHRWLWHTLRTENAYFHTPRLYCAHSSMLMM